MHGLDWGLSGVQAVGMFEPDFRRAVGSQLCVGSVIGQPVRLFEADMRPVVDSFSLNCYQKHDDSELLRFSQQIRSVKRGMMDDNVFDFHTIHSKFHPSKFILQPKIYMK